MTNTETDNKEICRGRGIFNTRDRMCTNRAISEEEQQFFSFGFGVAGDRDQFARDNFFRSFAQPGQPPYVSTLHVQKAFLQSVTLVVRVVRGK